MTGEELQKFRQDRGMSRHRMALALGVTVYAVVCWERRMRGRDIPEGREVAIKAIIGRMPKVGGK